MEAMLAFFTVFYEELRGFFAPLARILFPYTVITVNGYRVEILTANSITIMRTALVFPIFYLLQTGYTTTGFVLFVIAGVMDFVDGLVATIHTNQGYPHDKHLGAFLDAFCDKIFWGLSLCMICFMSTWQTTLHWGVYAIFFTESCCLCLYELILAWIRVSDYYHNTIQREATKSERDLRATGSGKVKFLLEMIGVGGFIFAYPSLFTHWAGYVGMASLFLAIPFAHKSLRHKLRERRST